MTLKSSRQIRRRFQWIIVHKDHVNINSDNNNNNGLVYDNMLMIRKIITMIILELFLRSASARFSLTGALIQIAAYILKVQKFAPINKATLLLF